MESIIHSIRQVPVDGNWPSIISTLKSKTDVIVAAAQNIIGEHTTTLLASLSVNQFPTATCGVGFLLWIQSENLPEAAQVTFIRQATAFICSANSDHAKIIHKEVAAICGKITSLGPKHNYSLKIIRALRHAIDLTAPNVNCLTPAHTYLLQACFSAQMYTYAVEFIRSAEIYEINPAKTSLTSLEYLKYFYYSGLCFIAVKDFAAALEAFTQVIVTPANALSAVVVSSIKKAKLVSLIHTGSTFSVPSRALSNVVNRFWNQDMPVYDEIERLYKANDLNNLVRVIYETGTEQLNKDFNLGLAQQVLACHSKHRIKNLTKTYITLSLQDIAAKVGSDPTTVEKHLFGMIKKGEIQASIDAVTNMVRFGGVGSSSSSTNGVNQNQFNVTIERALDQTMILSNKLRDMHKNVLTTNSYLLKSVPGGHRGGGGGMNAMGMGMGMGMGMSGFVDDAMDFY